MVIEEELAVALDVLQDGVASAGHLAWALWVLEAQGALTRCIRPGFPSYRARAFGALSESTSSASCPKLCSTSGTGVMLGNRIRSTSNRLQWSRSGVDSRPTGRARSTCLHPNSSSGVGYRGYLD